MRVLVAEDERLMADAIAVGLRRRAMAVDVCYDGDAALERVMVHRYDVVILERDLPKVHGDVVCRRIVATGGETRVLMLTAAAGIRDRVDGLDLGADDYLTKPFAFAELVARVGSLGRRARPALPPVLERAGIRLDLPRRQAWRDGLLLELTPKEFGVLEVLMRAEGRKQTQFAPLSRSVSGTRGRSLIVSLPGSPAGAKASLESVISMIPHALNLLEGTVSQDHDHGAEEKLPGTPA